MKLAFMMFLSTFCGERQHVVSPADLNQNNILFGGVIMSEMDRACGIAVRKMVPEAVTVDAQVKFLSAAKQKDLIVTTARIKAIGTKSLTVDVVMKCGDRVVASGVFIFVAVRDGKAVEIK